MKKLIVILFFIFTANFIIMAQDYRTGIGLRVGLDWGFSVKHFLNENQAIEGIVGSRWKGFIITSLYEFENPAFNIPGLAWYYGVGAHLGFWKENNYDIYWWESDHTGGYTVLGADAIMGIGYTFNNVPFNISIDWKPAINFAGYVGFWGDMGAITVRYAIK